MGSAAPLRTFYRYWTAKESLIKADGRGLQIALSEFEVGDSIPQAGIQLSENRWYIRELDVFPGYACHIACENPPLSLDMEAVTVPELDV
jgi:4'-phosphopantetheinyl transferase